MRKIVIAIDGYSGTGKSSTAKAVANKLSYRYIDSGAMYRAVTFYLISEEISLEDMTSIEDSLDRIDLDFQVNENGESLIYLNDKEIESEIRKPNISDNVSTVAAIPAVRRKLVELQSLFGKKKGIVMDGRDIGTVVFPEAELKVFMSADVTVRAKRRLHELEIKGINVELSEVENNLIERDRKDTTRKDSPLTKAADAVEIDTTHLTFQDQVDKIVEKAAQLISE